MPLMRKPNIFNMIDSTLKQLCKFLKERNYNVLHICFNQAQFFCYIDEISY